MVVVYPGWLCRGRIPPAIRKLKTAVDQALARWARQKYRGFAVVACPRPRYSEAVGLTTCRGNPVRQRGDGDAGAFILKGGFSLVPEGKSPTESKLKLRKIHGLPCGTYPAPIDIEISFAVQ
jgi:hypothetical protein